MTRQGQVARWLVLTRETLPAMAAARGWPIRLDHCFMRVCLDAALGTPWTRCVPRPAIRTMSDAQLAEAIAVAETIVAHPDRLFGLNEASLLGRAALRRTAAA